MFNSVIIDNIACKNYNNNFSKLFVKKKGFYMTRFLDIAVKVPTNL